MLFFDLKKLEQASKGNSFLFVNNFKKLVKKPGSGLSFILNPEPILNSSEDVNYLVQYIKLAAKRDYNLFKATRYSQLNLSYFPEIDVSLIKHNPLIKIANQQINFKYEDIYNGIKF